MVIFTIVIGIISAIGVFYEIGSGRKKQPEGRVVNIAQDQTSTENATVDARSFIQKYNALNNSASEIYLLPLCVTAYKYDALRHWNREIYREFCTLTDDVRREILRQWGLNYPDMSLIGEEYYNQMVGRIINTIETKYDDSAARNHFFKEHGKYFKRALTRYDAELVPDSLRCELDEEEIAFRKSRRGKLCRNADDSMDFDEHLTNLFAYHKDEKPLSVLMDYFCKCDELIATWMCCRVAIVTARYNYKLDTKSHRFGDDYDGQMYMEDMFLQALWCVEHYSLACDDLANDFNDL